MLLGHLDSFIGRNEKPVRDMSGYIEFLRELKEKEVDCFYSQLTALCGVHTYPAMRDWIAGVKKIIPERGADS